MAMTWSSLEPAQTAKRPLHSGFDALLDAAVGVRVLIARAWTRARQTFNRVERAAADWGAHAFGGHGTVQSWFSRVNVLSAAGAGPTRLARRSRAADVTAASARAHAPEVLGQAGQLARLQAILDDGWAALDRLEHAERDAKRAVDAAAYLIDTTLRPSALRSADTAPRYGLRRNRRAARTAPTGDILRPHPRHGFAAHHAMARAA